MIKLENLLNIKAIDLLYHYDGINPYILNLKDNLITKKGLILTDNQARYIVENHDLEPQYINKLLEITPYFGEDLKKTHNLKFTPNKILAEFLLAETEKTYHIYGKLTKNGNSKMLWIPKTQLFTDPYYEPIEVEVNFDYYDNILKKYNKKLYEHQKEGIKFLLGRNGAILADDMGLGKMELIDNKVFTPYGRCKIGDLKVGDKIIGSNGKPCNVTGVFPKGKQKLFRVTFNDGCSILVGGEHLWTVSPYNSDENCENRYITLNTEQMLDKELELTQIGTESNEKRLYKFKTYYKQKNGKSKWQIPIVKPIEFYNNVTLPIEPYLLGLNLSETKSDTKFISDIYKYSSIENRLAILQGLMDTNGRIIKTKNGELKGVEYCTTSERLVDDVAEIVHSLGGIVRKNKIGKYKKTYKLNINLPNEFNPFRSKIKSNDYIPPKKYKISRYIKNIELECEGEAVCISVDAPNKLYVTEHAIVTHNTTQSIIAALETNVKKILVVCPSSTKINWEREINVFDDDTAIIDGKKFKDAKFTIINFDILKNFHSLPSKEKINIKRDLVDAKFDLCIIDEAHFLKNNSSTRSKIMVDLTVNFGIDKVWLLTGTPIANRPIDFYNLLKLIKSPLTNNWKHYVTRYCEGRKFFKTLKNGKKKQIWLTNGASNLEELGNKSKNILLRRLKTEVLDMPDKIITPTYQVLNDKQRKEYDYLWDDFVEKRKSLGKRSLEDKKDLVELILLRKFIAMQAIPYTIDMVENALEMDKKVVIFTSFNEEINELANHFGNQCVIHNGSMTTINKQKSVDKFQTDPNIKVFIGNIHSAGVGITLTSGTVVIFNSFDWVPGNNEQAEDRCFRLGQKNDVVVYYQLFENTVSLRMWETLKYKQDIINTIMGKELTDEEITYEILKTIYE